MNDFFPPGAMIISGSCCDDMSELRSTTVATMTGSRDWHSSSNDQSETTGQSGTGSEFVRTRLHGRHEEISKMKKCFQDVTSDGTAQLLLVAGVSGSGKSALVESMRDFVTSSECNGFFCEGKFEQSLLDGGTNEPFSALATAFSDVIDFILNHGENLQEKSQAVSSALGADASVLVDLVPNLSLLLGGAPHFAASSQEGASTKTSIHLSILFRNFLQSLTSEESPILLFLDDLQFADDDSLAVFRALVTDSSLKHVLIVGSYRSNEMSAMQLLNRNDSSKKRVSSTLLTTTIYVGDLDLPAINIGLAEKLNLDERTTKPLSKVVLQKSGGNPFHVTQYLKMLEEKQLLVYNENDDRWSWDIDKILMLTNVSNNVLELVSQRLQTLPDEAKALLTLIAFVGFKFKLELVEIILRRLAGMSSSNSHTLESQCIIDKAVMLLRDSSSPTENLVAIKNVLRKAAKDGLIEKCSKTMFKFTHDRIQQALYEMVKTESASSELHYYIGHAVSSFEFDSMEEKRANLFFVADQLNRGSLHVTEEAEVIELAETNLKVGKVAASQAAYLSAATYLRSGINLLQDVQYWSSHYSLMLDLCSSTAEIEAKVSNFEKSRQMCDIILQQALSVDDKVRAYVCLVTSYWVQESLDDAVRVGVEFLSLVGVHLPKCPTVAHVTFNLIQTKKCMYKVSDSMILQSPMMSNYKMSKAIEVLNVIATAYYMMEDAGEMFAIIVMRMVQLTRRFGLAEASAQGFAMYGMLNSNLGDHKQALRYGKLALNLLESPAHDNQSVAAGVLTLLYHFVMWWEIPVQECTKPFMRGVNVGKQQGVLDWAYFSGLGVLTCMVHSGYHLYETVDVARELCSEMIEYEAHSPGRMSLPYWQIAENLSGRGDNTYKLTGNVMNEDDMMQTAIRNKNLIALEVINSLRLCAAVIFQQWDLASEIAPSVVKGIKFFDAHFVGFTTRLYLGLTYSESYLRHGKREDLRKLIRIIRKMKHWERVGVNNCKPLRIMLEAELSASNPSTKSAHKEATKALFETAIEQCHVQDFIHYRAIASERASRVCQLHQDRQGAVVFMGDSIDCYRDWGADAKVEQMEEMYFDIIRLRE